MRAKAREHGIHIVATIFEAESAGICYDSAIVIDPAGAISAATARRIRGGPQPGEDSTSATARTFRCSVRDWGGQKLCYDTFFPEVRTLRRGHGAELIVVPSRAAHRLLARDHADPRLRERRLLAPWQQGGAGGRVDLRRAQHDRGPPIPRCWRGRATEVDETITATLERERVFARGAPGPCSANRRPDLYTSITTPTEDIPRAD